MGQRDLQQMCLPNKLHIQNMAHLQRFDRHRLLADQPFALGTLAGQQLVQLVYICLIQRLVEIIDKIMAQISDHTAQRIGNAGAGRDQNFRNAQLSGQS